MSSDDSDCEPLSVNTTKTDIYPVKSKDRYIYAYENFLTWRKDKDTDSLNEDIILSYFEEMSAKYKPSTLWAMYSMLKCGLKRNHDICMENYRRVVALLRNLNKGYVCKKLKALSIENIEKFIDEAPDDKYLATKVALILGVTGGLRRQELSLLTTSHIENHGEIFIIKIPHTKNKLQDSFVVPGKYYKTVKKYQDLRVASAPSNRFFQAFRDGKCRAQVIGKNKFGKMPKEIAEFLKLPDAKSYTGHTLRAGSRVPVEKVERCAGEPFVNDSDSSTRTQPEPSPSGPNRGKQCRFCGDFKECSPVVQKPYLMGNKTSLALNHLRVELDFSIDSLPKTICRDCDAKLLETFEFIKQVNTAQFSLVAVCPNNATNANNSVNSRNNKFQHIEIDTQIVKAEFESTDEDSDESKVEIRQDALTLGETIYLRETHKRKHGVDDKKMKKVKKGKRVKSLSTELIIDIKQERMENEDKNSEDSVDFSDTGTEVKPSELELAESSLDYQKGKQTFSDTRVKGKKSSEECND
ncbi:uncharacterized protein LOC133531880 isoform X3 [Cydia pomonella]|uniref:uncharacterized protein LOC133531880 isoform X3 n=1 Tax=Cydia pomonella TaxID=82600 RepID=UPI002ADDBFA7|nr:uncharacterized protein LOC133531880 isoform X3 [Cydia pomonella]